MDKLPEALQYVPPPRCRIPHDRSGRNGLGSIKEPFDIDYVDFGFGLELEQKFAGKKGVFVVPETHQVISRGRRREPIGCRTGGECELHAAAPKEQHLRARREILYGGLQVYPEGSVFVVAITRIVAIGQVPIGRISGGLAGEDAVGPNLISTGCKKGAKYD